MKGLVDGDETARVAALRDDVSDTESEFDRRVLKKIEYHVLSIGMRSVREGRPLSACDLSIEIAAEMIVFCCFVRDADVATRVFDEVDGLVRPSMYHIDEIVDLEHETLADDYYLPQEAPLMLSAMRADGIYLVDNGQAFVVRIRYKCCLRSTRTRRG